jgi:hypothetical protein
MRHRQHWLRVTLWAAWGIYAVAMLASMPLVPFHPDESTHIYLSQDFDRLVWQLDPAGVTWVAAGTPAAVRRYRLLEAPLSRYMIGLARGVSGQRAAGLTSDWDWSATWEANVAAGAFPDEKLLRVARLPATLGTLLGALLVFAIGRRAGGLVAGCAAATLYALNGVLWLHGRRGMSEGLAVFALLLAVWVIVRLGQRPAAVGAAVAVAAAAKLTGVALLPAAVLAVLVARRGAGWAAVLKALVWLGLSSVVCAWILYPALWAAPGAGLAAMATARGQLLAAQTTALRAAGGPVVAGPALQTVALIYHLYFAPLAFWELPNYAAATAAAEARYLALPWQNLFHTPAFASNLVPGALLLALTLLGVALSGCTMWRPDGQAIPAEQRTALLCLFATTFGLAATAYALPIAWQRYYVPLIPFVCLWSGLGVAALVPPFAQRWPPGRPHDD